jgi:hypothetical protein
MRMDHRHFQVGGTLRAALLLGVLAGCGGGGGSSASAGGGGLPPAPTPVGDTGYISQPPLVSAGMTGIVASVPDQGNTSWSWSVTGASADGVLSDAALLLTAGSGSSFRTQCSVDVAGTTTIYYQDSFVVPPMTVTPSFYGSGLIADALANTQVGGPDGNQISYRFRSLNSGALTGVRVFYIWSTSKAGYNAGTGGTVQLALLADDGSAAHLPTGPALASTRISQITAGSFYPQLTFSPAPTLVAGTLYHLCFSNVDPDPAANYVSVDCLYDSAQIAPAQAVISDTDLATLLQQTGTGWAPRPGYTPIVEFDFSAASQGVGYMEVWSSNPKTISGQAMVREHFTVSGGAFTARQVMVRVTRQSGQSPLQFTLQQDDGTVLETGTVPAADILPGVSWWASYSFASPRTLAAGGSYDLVLASAADTVYSAFPYRKGSDKGFGGTTLFPDGYAQFTTTGASGWTGWDMWGQTNRTDGDLEFLFIP